MLDIRYLRTEPEAAKAALARRGEDASVIDALLLIDSKRRVGQTEQENLKAEQNRLGPQIAQAKKSGGDAAGLLARSSELKAAFQDHEETVRVLDERQLQIIGKLPNLPHRSVHAGGADDGIVLHAINKEPRRFDFEPKPHWDLATNLDLIDFERGTKLAGSGFLLYTGMGARIERALVQFMLDLHTEKHGYTELGLPYALSRESMTASGHLVKFAPEMYRDEESDLFFLPTAEPALVNVHRGEILEAGMVPLKYVAHTPCWRREAGAAGRDTRGLLRVHQFDKVELFRFALPETSFDALDQLTREACAVLDALDLPYRILKLAGGDISFASAMTYDIETWAPGVGKWLEVSSASNCTDFQARRANIRFRREPGAKTEFPHLLNASGLALPRVLATLLETHQNADGTVNVPDALRPYLGGRSLLGNRP